MGTEASIHTFAMNVEVHCTRNNTLTTAPAAMPRSGHQWACPGNHKNDDDNEGDEDDYDDEDDDDENDEDDENGED